MTKLEVVDLLTQKGLLKVKSKNRIIEYIDGSLIFYDDTFHHKINVYGVYFDTEFGIYVFFITGEEKGGVMIYHRIFNNEDDAFTAMYKFIEREYRIYGK